jgi:hypothetical protein
MQKRSGESHSLNGRGERIRTSDLSVPNAARCRAAPLPVNSQHTMRQTSWATLAVRCLELHEVGLPQHFGFAAQFSVSPTRCLRPQRTHLEKVHHKHIRLSLGRPADIRPKLSHKYVAGNNILIFVPMDERSAVLEALRVIYPCPVVASGVPLLNAARVAQWIERHRPKVGAGGSNPSAGAKNHLMLKSVFRPSAFCSPPPT